MEATFNTVFSADGTAWIVPDTPRASPREEEVEAPPAVHPWGAAVVLLALTCSLIAHAPPAAACESAAGPFAVGVLAGVPGVPGVLPRVCMGVACALAACI